MSHSARAADGEKVALLLLEDLPYSPEDGAAARMECSGSSRCSIFEPSMLQKLVISQGRYGTGAVPRAVS